MTVEEVVLDVSLADDTPSYKTINRYRQGKLPRSRQWGMRGWHGLDRELAGNGTLLDAYRRYVNEAAKGSPERTEGGIRGPFSGRGSSWTQTIPMQRYRDHESVDVISIRSSASGSVEGTIRGESPEDRKGVRWTFTGFEKAGGMYLFLTFESRTAGWESSNGTIALQLVGDKPRRYEGYFARVVPGTSGNRIKVRKVVWDQRQ